MTIFSGAWPRFRRAPVASALAVAVQAMGISGTVAVFAIAHELRERRPSGIDGDADDLVQLGRLEPGCTGVAGFSRCWNKFPFSEFDAHRRRNETLADVAASNGRYSVSVRTPAGLDVVPGVFSTSNYLRVLGVRPLLGRSFTEDEERPGGDPVCLLGERLVRRWGLQDRVPGATLVANGTPLTVVGVLSEDFFGTNGWDLGEIWLPLGQHRLAFPNAPDFSILDASLAPRLAPFQVVARLAPGATSEAAGVDATTTVRQQEREYLERFRGARVRVEPLRAYAGWDAYLLWRHFTAMGLAAALLLAMTVLNVSGLGLAMGLRRRREVAVRLTLGARPGRVVREQLLEWLGVAPVAAGLGLAGAAVLLRVLARVAPAFGSSSWVLVRSFPELVQSVPVLNPEVAVFVVIASILSVLASALLPAWSAARSDPMLTFREADLGQRRLRGGRTAVLTAQVAGVALLAAVAGAAAHGLWLAEVRSPGFDARGLAVARLDTFATGDGRERTLGLARRLLQELGARPDVEGATLSRLRPFGLSVSVPETAALVHPDGDRPLGNVRYDEVAPSYFGVMGIPVLMGRSFAPGEGRAEPVIVVNRAAARRWPWPGETPIGSVVRLGRDGTPHTVVGVVGDVRPPGVSNPPEPFAYVPLDRQREGLSVYDQLGLTLALRGRGEPRALESALESAMAALDADVPVGDLRPVSELVADALRFESLIGTLNAAAGVVALLVCCLGLYATAAQLSLERQRDFAVRIALGARPSDLVRLMGRWWAAAIGTGVALGLASGAAAVWAISRRTGLLLSGDPVVLLAVAVAISAVCLATTSVPLWRVLRAEPAAPLRLTPESR